MTCDYCGRERETSHRMVRFTHDDPSLTIDLCGPCERELRQVEDVASIVAYPLGASTDS